MYSSRDDLDQNVEIEGPKTNNVTETRKASSYSMYTIVVPETGISNYVGTLDQVWQNIPTRLAKRRTQTQWNAWRSGMDLPNPRHRPWFTLIALKRLSIHEKNVYIGQHTIIRTGPEKPPS